MAKTPVYFQCRQQFGEKWIVRFAYLPSYCAILLHKMCYLENIKKKK